ncbi:MAG: hypothetical protein AAGC60_14670 [Acidobacteriota bacterium]
MSAPPRRWLWSLGGLAAVAVVVLLVLPEPEAAGSSLSRAPSGWWATRAYLEARGVEVTLRDVPFDHHPAADHGFAADRDFAADRAEAERPRSPEGLVEAEPIDADVVAVVFPLQRSLGAGEIDPLAAHLRAGGVLMIGYSGDEPSPSETRLLELVGFGDTVSLRASPPLAPRAWWRHRGERFTLEPTSGHDGAPLEVAAFDLAPARGFAPAAPGQVFYTVGSPSHDAPVALVESFEHLGGRVVLLPAALLANDEVAGSVDLLESLTALGARWSFAEHLHGVLRPSVAAASSTTVAWDLFVLHLLLVYLVLAAMVAVRFGPPWRESLRAHGSTADFLRSLGTLHHRLRHHHDAARRLRERVERLDPRAQLPDLPLPVAGDGDGLVRFARAIARARRPGATNPRTSDD